MQAQGLKASSPVTKCFAGHLAGQWQRNEDVAVRVGGTVMSAASSGGRGAPERSRAVMGDPVIRQRMARGEAAHKESLRIAFGTFGCTVIVQYRYRTASF